MSEEKKEIVAGYKIVDKYLRGKNGFQYTVGQTATQSGQLQAGINGLHFCPSSPAACYNQIDFTLPLRYLLVSSRGEVIKNDEVSVTLSLHVDKEVSRDVWMKILTDQYGEHKAQGLHNIDDIGYAAGCEGNFRLIQRIDDIGHAAGCEGNLRLIQRIVNKSPTVNDSCLLGAAHFGRLSCVRYMLGQYKPDSSALNSALNAASAFGDKQVASILISRGATNMESGLATAASVGKTDMMEFFVARGATMLSSAMDDAVESGQVAAVAWLIERDAAVPAYLLRTAVHRRHANIVHILITKKIMSSDALNMALRSAAADDNIEIMAILSANRADEFNGAFRVAGISGALHAMRFAVEHGANDTYSVLSQAVHVQAKPVLQFLAENGSLAQIEKALTEAKAIIAH